MFTPGEKVKFKAEWKDDRELFVVIDLKHEIVYVKLPNDRHLPVLRKWIEHV